MASGSVRSHQAQIIAFIVLLFHVIAQVHGTASSFTIDYDNDTFLKDGKPFFYVSGSYHYARVPFQYWEDRMQKVKAAGLDAIQVYVPWNIHEPYSGVYDFEGQQDLEAFLGIAKKYDVLVILRAGPYICGEWEFGGFPAWLLRENGSVVLRTMDPGYITYVDRWFKVLLPKVKTHLYENGGQVIMVQIENEYGSYFACDHVYMAHLRDLARSLLGSSVLLYTTDGSGAGFLRCGAIDGVYATVDFGPGNMTAGFAPMRQYNPKGPLVNSEFYTGWLDHWGGGHAHGNTDNIVKSLGDGLAMKASVNMYMFEGGTNFGYMNGADPTFEVCPTSYDYDAPLSEAGDMTDKYMAIREVIGKYKTLPPGPLPRNSTKQAYGTVQMTKISTVLEALPYIGPSKPVTSDYPLSMEQVGQNYGFILYRHVLTSTRASALLEAPGIRDRGYVLLDGSPVGLLDRSGITSMNLVASRAGQTLDIIVENQGRINFGKQILGQRKGLISNVTLDGTNLTSWKIFSLNFSTLLHSPELTKLKFRSDVSSVPLQPSIYVGHFSAPEQHDTFLDPSGWGKGQAFVNSMNVGRYWPSKGPQVTLYVPGCALKKDNTLLLVELESAPDPLSAAMVGTGRLGQSSEGRWRPLRHRMNQ